MALHRPENKGRHIPSIVGSVGCYIHGVKEGDPCYLVPVEGSKAFLWGVCGSRIKKAGHNGKISPMALQMGRPGGRTGPKR